MDVVFQTLPFLHPLAVHFPVAFATGALLAGIVWAVTGGRFWRFSTLLLLSLGFIGGALAYLSGDAVPEGAADYGTTELLSVHASSGGYSFLLTGVALLLLVALNFYLERRTTIRRHPPDPVWVRAIVMVAVIAAWLATAVAGYSGHLLVWGPR